MARLATDRQLVVEFGGRPQAVVRRGFGGFDLHQHVGALVLDGLEGADGTAELMTDLRVIDRHLEGLGCAADLLGG